MNYKDVTTTNFQGAVVAFCRGTDDGPANTLDSGPDIIFSDIYFNVLSLDPQSQGDDIDWSGFRKLGFVNCVRPAGMNIVNVTSQYTSTADIAGLQDAGKAFRVITNQDYIYIFRQTVNGSLLSSRFRLIHRADPSDPQNVVYELEPAWEVRFQRSEKPDTPADAKDIQDYANLDDMPFLEPDIELFMIQGLTEGNFDVAFLPKDNSTLLTCQVFLTNLTENRIDVYSLPLDTSGLYDLTGKKFVNNTIPPDYRFQIKDPQQQVIPLFGAPAASFYVKQERTVDSQGGAILIKRSGRLMLAVVGKPGGEERTLVTVDFGVANDGTLAQPDGALVAGPVGVANYALEFDPASYVAFNDITLNEEYAIEFWINPQSLDIADQLIIGNSSNPELPYVRLIQGYKIKTGFTGANGAPLAAITGNVIQQNAWNHVVVGFNPAVDPKFSVTVNGDLTPVTVSGTGDKPAGALNVFSSTTNGFVGDLDDMRIYKSAIPALDKLVSEWPFDTIEYADNNEQTLDPPRTPNTIDVNNYGKVYGARLVPSLSPASTGDAGTVTWDLRGLSIYTSYFKGMSQYGEIKSSPCLLEGSDGLLHCYFQGRDDLFCVMQYSMEAARATFQAPWAPYLGDGAPGSVDFVSTQSGSFMNTSAIRITDVPSPDLNKLFCDLTIELPSGRKETWNGVPRSLSPFGAPINGDSISDPTDPRLRNGLKTYFDINGDRTAAYVPIDGNPLAAMLAFVTRFESKLPLLSVSIGNIASNKADAELKFRTPRWAGTELRQSWKGIPASVLAFIDTLNGLSSSYNYKDPTYSNIATYSIVAKSGLVSNNPVIFFAHPDVSEVNVLKVADGANQDLCEVSITLKSKGATLTAKWTNVQRLQQPFAATIEGTDPTYDYGKDASGDYAAVGNLLIITTNGVNANVANVDKAAAGGIIPADNDMLVGASLFSLFSTASVQSSTQVTPTTNVVPGSKFQKGYYEQGVDKVSLTTGSTLFRIVPATIAVQGTVGIVQNTSGLTDGTAKLIVQGINGGWLNEADQRTLAFNWDNWVSFETSPERAPNIDKLTIDGDLSLELWCKPLKSLRNSMKVNQRLLTFNRKPTGMPDSAPVTYMAGLRDCPSLICSKDTNVRQGYNLSSGTFYAWFSPESVTGGKPGTGVIGSILTLLIAVPVLTVTLNADQKIQVDFGLTTGMAPIVSEAVVSVENWYQVCVPFSITTTKSGSDKVYTVVTSLYVNGVKQGTGTTTYAATRSDSLAFAAYAIGDVFPTKTTLPMSVNECAFFHTELTAEKIAHYFEQRIPANEQGMVLKWELRDGIGSTAVNSGSTGSDFNASILPKANWNEYGLYFKPVLGYGDNIGILADQPIIHGWSHISLVHQTGYALHVTGTQFADCGNDSSLELGNTFALESWALLDPGGASSQTVLAKGSDYQIWIPYTRKPRFEALVKIGDAPQVIQVDSDVAMEVGKAYYIAVNYQVVTAKVKDGDKMLPKYELHIDMYMNGQLVAQGVKDGANYKQYDDSIDLASSSASLNLARSPQNNGSRYLTGYLSDVRLWTRNLTLAEIISVNTTHRAPTNHDGLISSWNFSEKTGKTAYDSQGNNNAKLSESGLTVTFKPTSGNWFYVNAQESKTPEYADTLASVGGYGTEDQFLLSRVSPVGYYGKLDEVRIWNIQLTQEQIADSMNRSLSGSEPGLVGYWNFSNGCGTVLTDQTGRGNNGTLTSTTGKPLPVWGTSDAPINNEAGQVYNILGGVPTFALSRTNETPSVIEYADVQRDAYGTVFSVMKRAYVYIDGTDINFVTRYKVGDLDTVYIGQAQSKPSLIGFVEGAPPIPSENQTMPYWAGFFSEINEYGDATSIEFEEASDVTYTLNAERDVADTNDFSMKGGGFIGGQFSTSEGLGFEVENPILVLDGRLGDQNHIEIEGHAKSESEIKYGGGKTLTSKINPGGSWEAGKDPAGWVNPVVGRRYVPSNTGFALVKSLTADVYASVLKSTGTMVKMTLVPNPDIPQDVNIIDFPINPHYVKNGTLDGKVGLKNDPDYPNADLVRGSYFKPIEAYAMKRRIERDEKQLEAYYKQYDVSRQSGKLRSSSNWSDFQTSMRSTPAYDWARHLAKRNIVNTYVWNAGIGSYAEETEAMNVYSETYSAISSVKAGLGAIGDFKIAAPIAGPFIEFDYMYTSATEVNAVKTKEQGAKYSLKADADPDPFLCAPRVEGPDEVTFSETPTEGKVDDYRYMAFFLAPTTDNFTSFLGQVVDKDWLTNSLQSNAVALREVTDSENGVWRILYRVTYVSRIPPQFQPVPSESQPPDTQPPANLEYNTLMVQLVSDQIASEHPSTLEIGTAVTAVLGTPDKPGILASVLAWWTQFMAETLDYKLPWPGVLSALREDLLRYMIDKYAATENEPNAQL